MFELPEYITLARQLNESVAGKIIARGSLGGACYFCPGCQV